MQNHTKLIVLISLALFLIITFLFISVDINYFSFVMQLRIPKLMAIILASFCIGTASIVFQSIINNRIVTPCLLGMNSLYTLIHTFVFFVLGSASIFVINRNLFFALDLVLMVLTSLTLYGFLFKKLGYNILYIVLAGTVLSTLFTSISSTLIRAIDPNEFTILQNSLLAGFNNANTNIILFSLILIALVGIYFIKDLQLLDIITLGKNQAINLGVDYDRTILRLLVAVTISISIATAIVGPISFLGLIIANVSRELFKTYKNSILMLGSFLSGLIILLLGQILIEHVFAFTTVIAVFVNLFGGLYFLYLIIQSKKEMA